MYLYSEYQSNAHRSLPSELFPVVAMLPPATEAGAAGGALLASVVA